MAYWLIQILHVSAMSVDFKIKYVMYMLIDRLDNHNGKATRYYLFQNNGPSHLLIEQRGVKRAWVICIDYTVFLKVRILSHMIDDVSQTDEESYL